MTCGTGAGDKGMVAPVAVPPRDGVGTAPCPDTTDLTITRAV